MNKSTQVLVLHCSLFFLLVLSCLFSPVVKYWYPVFYEEIFFPTYFVLGFLTILGWSPYLGGCTLTKLEKQFLARENRPVYEETFLYHYISKWTGLKVPKRLITITLLGLMFLPVVARFTE
jgi:hypothetical protein